MHAGIHLKWEFACFAPRLAARGKIDRFSADDLFADVLQNAIAQVNRIIERIGQYRYSIAARKIFENSLSRQSRLSVFIDRPRWRPLIGTVGFYRDQRIYVAGRENDKAEFTKTVGCDAGGLGIGRRVSG